MLAERLSESENGPLRSGVVLAVASAPVRDVTDADKQAWEPVLSNWFTTAPDTLTHSAAGWALRQWNLELPEISTSKTPADGMDWHVNGVGMTMLSIPKGSFVRKSFFGKDTIDQTVTLTRSFLLGDGEVTQAQFQQFIYDPDCLADEKPKDWKGADPEYSPTEQHPVQQVNWHDAVLFCNWLSRKNGLTPCYERTGEQETTTLGKYDSWRLTSDANGYRLPTEAEWEYACRAGTVTRFTHGEEELLLDRYAVFGASRTELPGSKLPNGWGLFDCHGNVWEWCQDWHRPFGGEPALSDPTGPAQGSSRVLRGGSFLLAEKYLRSSFRYLYQPVYRDFGPGFRVARTYP
jgi:formylglycine-generating enzyme required for sulfatase activity